MLLLSIIATSILPLYRNTGSWFYRIYFALKNALGAFVSWVSVPSIFDEYSVTQCMKLYNIIKIDSCLGDTCFAQFIHAPPSLLSCHDLFAIKTRDNNLYASKQIIVHCLFVLFINVCVDSVTINTHKSDLCKENICGKATRRSNDT